MGFTIFYCTKCIMKNSINSKTTFRSNFYNSGVQRVLSRTQKCLHQIKPQLREGVELKGGFILRGVLGGYIHSLGVHPLTQKSK